MEEGLHLKETAIETNRITTSVHETKLEETCILIERDVKRCCRDSHRDLDLHRLNNKMYSNKRSGIKRPENSFKKVQCYAKTQLRIGSQKTKQLSGTCNKVEVNMSGLREVC